MRCYPKSISALIPPTARISPTTIIKSCRTMCLDTIINQSNKTVVVDAVVGVGAAAEATTTILPRTSTTQTWYSNCSELQYSYKSFVQKPPTTTSTYWIIPEMIKIVKSTLTITNKTSRATTRMMMNMRTTITNSSRVSFCLTLPLIFLIETSP